MSLKTPVLDELTAEQFEAARRSFEEKDRTEPRVAAARYDAATQRLTLEMRGGAVVTLDPRVVSYLAGGTDAQLANLRVMHQGAAIFWDDLDAHVATPQFLAAVFGIRSASDSARKAGSVRSAAKTAAVRANGAKGGRPRKLVAAVETSRKFLKGASEKP